MRSLLAAIAMLSIIPVGNFMPTERELRRMVNSYPLAGALFAALFFGIGQLVAPLPPLVAAMLLTLLPEVLTKGLHLDGLADTADGFLSGRSRERKLEIMRDSRIGTMGVAAIFALLGLKFAIFASLRQDLLSAAAALMMLGGRYGMTWHIATSRYARPEGLGKLSFAVKPVWGLTAGTLLLAGAGYLLVSPFAGLWLTAGLVMLMLLWSRLTCCVIGGATGDTIGCAEELAELWTAALLLLPW